MYSPKVVGIKTPFSPSRLPAAAGPTACYLDLARTSPLRSLALTGQIPRCSHSARQTTQRLGEACARTAAWKPRKKDNSTGWAEIRLSMIPKLSATSKALGLRGLICRRGGVPRLSWCHQRQSTSRTTETRGPGSHADSLLGGRVGGQHFHQHPCTLVSVSSSSRTLRTCPFPPKARVPAGPAAG